ncbi:MAG TPA: nucleoside-diphosphate kinase, partial [Herpetosiphonaceae bacterium]|nr:nucleoside-diphosphate kinase [Herpetosiphonaceae bacterium]
EAVPALLQAKGVTQPAEAAPGSVRGGFWCDNGVCNLMHSSDDAAEAERELAALKLSRWLDEDPAPARLIDPVPAPASYAAHSGISVACEAVRRVLAAANAECPPPRLPESGGARETNRRLSAYLREAAARHPAAAPFVEAFLAGDLVAVTAMLPALPVTGWERFAIQCGAVNRDRWNAAA